VFKILGKLPHGFDSTAVMPKETKRQGLVDTKSAWLALGIRRWRSKKPSTTTGFPGMS